MVGGRREREGLVEEHEGEDEDDGLRDLAAEPLGREAGQQAAGPLPHLGEHVEVDEGDILDLAPQAVDEGEAGLGAAVGLALVVDLLRDLLLEHGGHLLALEDAVLTEGEERLEEEVADGEADDELLPGEERAVEGLREALRGVSRVRRPAKGGSPRTRANRGGNWPTWRKSMVREVQVRLSGSKEWMQFGTASRRG